MDRLTGRPDMTLDVYRGRKTTTQKQFIPAWNQETKVSTNSFYYILTCSYLALKVPNKNAADDILFFYFYLSKKMRLDFSCESSV